MSKRFPLFFTFLCFCIFHHFSSFSSYFLTCTYPLFLVSLIFYILLSFSFISFLCVLFFFNFFPPYILIASFLSIISIYLLFYLFPSLFHHSFHLSVFVFFHALLSFPLTFSFSFNTVHECTSGRPLTLARDQKNACTVLLWKLKIKTGRTSLDWRKLLNGFCGNSVCVWSGLIWLSIYDRRRTLMNTEMDRKGREFLDTGTDR
jgi:hypothetical protein